MNVKISDRIENIEYFRMALSMCEIGVSYQTAELIDEIVTAIRIKGGDFTVLDAAKLFSTWKQKWADYEKEQNKEE